MDGDTVSLEQKIYRTMDLHQDMGDLATLLKECEGAKDAETQQENIKKAKVNDNSGTVG